MKEISEDTLKQLELDILRYIRKCCEEHDLTYYLAYGTLIGAVRHQGFIPWDDDVDILMPREDYFRLMKIVEADNSHYGFVSMHNVPDFPFPLAKVVDTRTKLIQKGAVGTHEKLGAYVDVFILENFPADDAEGLRFCKQVLRAKKLWYLSQRRMLLRPGRKLKDLALACASLPFKLIPARKLALRMDAISAKYAGAPTGRKAAMMLLDHPLQGLLSDAEWADTCQVPFEGETFCTMSCYDKFLTNTYGDYMQPPPQAQQVSIHDFDVYWRDDQDCGQPSTAARE